jgi:oxygen-independent coproporphyrinogen-3 oxidase
VAGEVDLRFPSAGTWTVDTLYFGGGTPSRLGGAGIAWLLNALRRRMILADDAEVTLEANPEDVDADSVAAWRDAGVNRLSIGAQTFDDRVLKWMHRSHDAARIGHAADAARQGGIDNVSLDLIFSLPSSLDRSWTADVARALELEPSHVSLYGLTVEPLTPLGRWKARGEVAESPDERYEDEFLQAHDMLSAAGFAHYEVSNFGRPGRQSRHNTTYWSDRPYVGLGPSAHGFDGRVRRWNASAYADWAQRIAGRTDPIDGSEILTAENQIAERVYLGLRTTAGLVISDAEVARVRAWVEAGWARAISGTRVVLTPLGWLRLDSLAADLTLARSHY